MAFAIVSGVRLCYRVHGAGEPVLLIAGLGSSAAAWDAQVARLAAQYRVCSFDNRGVGRSSAPMPPYTMRQLAGDALGLMDRLGWASAHVVGVSMGGMVAQRLALTAPERVRSLGLLSTHAGGRSARPTATAVRGLIRSRFVGGRAAKVRNLIRMRHAESYIAEVGVDTVRQLVSQRLLGHPAPTRGFVGQLSAAMGHSALSELPRLRGRFPVTVLTGGADRMVRPENSDHIAELLGTEALRFDGRGHAILVEEAEAVSDVLLRLFERAR